MTAQSPSPAQPAAATARRGTRQARRTAAELPAAPCQAEANTAAPPEEADGEEDIAPQLSFRDAQTALEVSLAELQGPDLDVEEMAGLYRRASRYAERCEQLLQQVEQEVMQWDPGQPENPPVPYQA